MGFPKIKDRLFSQSKNRVFFMAETTQNELIAKPSSLSSHRKLNGIAQLLRPCMCVCARARMCDSPSNTRLVYVLKTVRRRESGLMFSAKTQKEA